MKTIKLMKFVFLVMLFCNLSVVAQPFKIDKYGYVADPKFRKFIKSNKYSLVGSFDTLSFSPLTIAARIIKNDRVGYIDLSGNEIISPKYQSISPFKNGVALFFLNNETAGLINYKGVEYTIKNSSCVQLYDKDSRKFSIKNTFGARLNDNGTSLVYQEFYKANGSFKSYTIIDNNFQIVLNDTVDYSSFYNFLTTNHFIYEKNNSFIIYNTQQKKIKIIAKSLLQDYYTSNTKGIEFVFKFYDEENYNILKSDGTISSISKKKPYEINTNSSDCDFVLKNKKLKLPFDFAFGLSIIDSVCSIDTIIIEETKQPHFIKKQGAINANCKMVIPFVYDYLSKFSNGYSIFKKGEKSGIIDTKGDIIFEKENIDLTFGKYGHLNTQIDNGVILFVDKKYTYKYGVMKVNGEVLIKPTYTSIYSTNQMNGGETDIEDYDSFENGIARYEKTGKIDKLGYDTNVRHGLIDKYGNEYLTDLTNKAVKIKNRENITTLLDNFVFFYNEPNQNNDPQPCNE